MKHGKEGQEKIAFLDDTLRSEIVERKKTTKYNAAACPPRLLVDVSELIRHDARTGIQRVTKSVLHAWTLNPPQGFKVTPIYGDERHYRDASVFFEAPSGRDKGTNKGRIVSGRRGDIYIALELNFSVIAKKEILQIWHSRGTKLCFMIHDILPLTLSTMFDKELTRVFAVWLKTVGGLADKLICVSKTVADELKNYLDNKKVRVRDSLEIAWNLHGADYHCLTLLDSQPGEILKLPDSLGEKPSFLMVATLEPRKCHHQVLSAFEFLWKKGHDVNLVLVGKEGWMVKPLVEKIRTHPELGRHLFWFEGVSDATLETIYCASTCLIMASLGEGFGLPLIEAAKHNLPIIARDIPIFREVMEDHAFYFKSKNADDLAEDIGQWLNHFLAGKAQKSSDISLRSWEESAQGLLEIILRPSSKIPDIY